MKGGQKKVAGSAQGDAQMSNQAQGAKNTNMTMTVGNKQPQDSTSVTDESKKSASSKEGTSPNSGVAKGGLSKLKDPNMAHETLEM